MASSGACLFTMSSAPNIANPDHFRYFEMCINQPGRIPDAQFLPLVLSPILQIKDSASAGDHLPPKAARNTRSYVRETPTAVLRQIFLQHHDQCFRLLEGDAAGHQAGNSHPVAPAKLQIVLEMDEPIRSGQTEDPTGANRPHRTDGKRQSALGSPPNPWRDAEARV